MDISTARVVASPDQVSSKVDGEEVILNLENGTYYGLNEVGARVWELIQEETAVVVIRDRLLEEYDVDVEQLNGDLIALLSDLQSADLVEIKPA